MSKLSQILAIKPGEGRTASFMIGMMFFTAIGASLGGTGIEALFFARFGVEYLPYMFIGLGITSMLTSLGITALLGRVRREILYIGLPIALAVVLVAARLAIISGIGLLYPALWLGKEILNSLTGIVIWGIAGAVCDTRQGKRLFPLFNATRILGQVVGGFSTGLLVNTIGTENLLLIWAGGFLLAFALARALLANRALPSASPARARRKSPNLAQEMQRGYQYVRTSSLMRWVSFAAILFSLLYFSIALPFSRAATEQYPNEDALASFLGLFNGVSTAAAFLVSLLIANRLLARFGIMACILAFPIIYFLGFGSLALLSTFAVIVTFRFIQMLWLSGIADPSYQAMLNVVPPERRDQVRTFISGVPEQAGTFIAGAILIIGEQALAPQQLYLIGLVAAALCIYVMWQAAQGYKVALVDALRAGRPQLFFSEEQPFGGFHQDALAIQTAINGISDTDPIIRRVSAEILGHLSLPEATEALVHGLGDSDSLVRAASLRGLAQAHAAPALLDIAASLSDPAPEVRFEAVSALSALTSYATGLTNHLTPMLDDADSRVSTRAALALLKLRSPAINEIRRRARKYLRQTAVLGEEQERLNAIEAMGEWGDAEAFDFLSNELGDRAVVPLIRRAILDALAKIDAERATPYFLDALAEINVTVRETAARLLGKIGQPAVEPVLLALKNSDQQEGALLALQQLPPPPVQPVLDYANAAVSRAVEYDSLMRGVQLEAQDEALSLLADALHDKSHEYGIRALRAIGLLSDRAAMSLAIQAFQSRDASQRANVLEALDSIGARWRNVLQPLMKLWEDESGKDTTEIDWARLLADEDDWVRECANYAAHKRGVKKMDTLATISLMDKILFLKRVPLFANLSPADIKQVASIATEEFFSDGEWIGRQGEAGETMFIILSGEVRVCTNVEGNEVELAMRKEGEHVGEMSLINREPRMASLVAIGDVRTLCIDQKSFEGLLRERPDASMAVISVLNKRLSEAARTIEKLSQERATAT